jgi:cytochrome oxidase assembly protein ShyY1
VRVLWKPKWIAGHLLVLTVVVVFVNLGLWQLDRHQWRAERNAAISDGLRADALPFDRLAPGRRDYRRTMVSGRYLPDREILLTPRNERGPGHHVLTPLRLGDGRLLVVDRGWVPFALDVPPVGEAPPPGGTVTVEGVLLPATQVDPKAVRDDDGRLLRVAAVAPQVVAGATADNVVADVFLLLREAPPAPGALPVPGELPALERGPHLSYSVQWLLFALVTFVGYPLLLRRAVRDAVSG